MKNSIISTSRLVLVFVLTLWMAAPAWAQEAVEGLSPEGPLSIQKQSRPARRVLPRLGELLTRGDSLGRDFVRDLFSYSMEEDLALMEENLPELDSAGLGEARAMMESARMEPMDELSDSLRYLQVVLEAKQSLAMKMRRILEEELKKPEQERSADLTERLHALIVMLENEIGMLRSEIGLTQGRLLEQEHEIEQNRLYLTGLSVGLVFLGLLSVLIFFLYANKKKHNKDLQQKNAIIQQQNEEIVTQNESISDQNRQLEQQNEEISRKNEILEDQKQEIEEQAEALAQKNAQLGKIDAIVQSINQEVDFTAMLQSVAAILGRLPGVQRSAVLSGDPSGEGYRLVAQHRWPEVDQRLAQEQIDERFAQAKALAPDMLLASREGAHTIALRVRTKDARISSGYFLLQNQGEAFSPQALNLLENLREHLTSAYVKTQLLANLQTTLKHLRETQEELVRKEKMASIGQLTQGIVDRIINPLNYINNFSELTREMVAEDLGELLQEMEEAQPGKQAELLDEIQDIRQNASDNLLKVVEHGKTATRIIKEMESLLKAKNIDFKPTELAPVLEQSAQEALAKLEKPKDFRLELDLPKGLPKVMAHQPDWSQIVGSLIDNALHALRAKAAKQPGFVPEIALAAAHDGQRLAILFRDNGTGIPKANLDKIFAPLFTTKPTSEATGLGLYMVQDMVKAHKGTLEVRSEEGAFTEIAIHLPLADAVPLS